MLPVLAVAQDWTTVGGCAAVIQQTQGAKQHDLRPWMSTAEGGKAGRHIEPDETS